MIKVYYQHEETGHTIEIFYENKKSIKELGRYIIYKTEEVKSNSYLIITKFCDDFILEIEQDINRPNNPDDVQLIREYMMNNYGNYDFQYMNLDELNQMKRIKI